MKKHLVLTLLAVITLLASCKKKDDDASTGPSYSSSYSYSNADYSDVTTRLNMFKYMETELKKSIPTFDATTGLITKAGQAVDSTRLVNIFTNTASPFDSTNWNNGGLNLANRNADASLVETYLGKYAAASHLATFNAVGTAAKATANVDTAGLAKNASNAYVLLGSDGINYAQMIQKVQFGSLIIQQIIDTLNIINDIDNTTLVTGKTYTAQEHAWDVAYGYLGFPATTVDNLISSTYVTANKSKFYYVGNYSTQTDNTTNLYATKKLATAFIIGRAAISSKDYATRDLQIDIIKTTLHQFLGATLIQEYTEYIAKTPADLAGKNGVVSEMIGMVVAMKYVPGIRVSAGDINDMLNLLHAPGTGHIHGIWDVSSGEIAQLKAKVVLLFGVDLKQ